MLKGKQSLMTQIMQYIEREELTELEEEGMAELLMLKDKITDLISRIASEAVQTKKHTEMVETHREVEQLRTVYQQQEIGDQPNLYS